MAKQFAVFGLGTFGYKIATTLMQEGAEVIAIDRDQGHVDAIKDLVTNALRFDATSEEALLAVRIQDVDFALVCMGDMEASILTSLLLKKIGVVKIIARASSPQHAQILELVGATEVVMPEEEMGIRLARRITATHLISHIQLAENHILAEILAPRSFIGKTLREADIRARFQVNVIAVKKKVPEVGPAGENIFVEQIRDVPDPDDIIEENDSLVVVGTTERVEAFRSAVEEG